MPSDIWAPMLTSNTSLCNKSLRARIKVAHVELFRMVARLVLRCTVTVIYGNRERRIQKIFSSFRKKEQNQGTIYNTDVRKILFITQYQMHTSECKRPPNRTYDGYLWKPAKRKKFARANNSDLLRALKHLIETKLYTSLSAEYIFICRIYF